MEDIITSYSLMEWRKPMQAIYDCLKLSYPKKCKKINGAYIQLGDFTIKCCRDDDGWLYVHLNHQHRQILIYRLMAYNEDLVVQTIERFIIRTEIEFKKNKRKK